jgi:hypothetical protein
MSHDADSLQGLDDITSAASIDATEEKSYRSSRPQSRWSASTSGSRKSLMSGTSSANRLFTSIKHTSSDGSVLSAAATENYYSSEYTQPRSLFSSFSKKPWRASGEGIQVGIAISPEPQEPKRTYSRLSSLFFTSARKSRSTEVNIVEKSSPAFPVQIETVDHPTSPGSILPVDVLTAFPAPPVLHYTPSTPPTIHMTPITLSPLPEMSQFNRYAPGAYPH